MADMRLLHGDCLERMGEIDSGSVDAIICDPPYGTVKNAPSTWDASKTEWDTTLDQPKMLEECNRILRQNGALILFSQDPYTGRLMTETHGNLPYSYRYTWKKDNFANHLGCKKAPVNYTEDVCVFRKRSGVVEVCDYSIEHPLRLYFFDSLKESGRDVRYYIELVGASASHYFTSGQQFRIPTHEKYIAMQDDGHFHMPYDEVRETHEKFKAVRATERMAYLQDIQQRYPSVFNLPPDTKYKSNILEYRKDYRGEHPTQKPVLLMEDLVRTYTNECDTVLDFTMGSGTTGVACCNTGREFIGIERDDAYFAISEKRIAEAVAAKEGGLF